MSIDKVNAQAADIQRHLEIKKQDNRHAEILAEQQRVAARKKDTEEKRIEMNRRMNRPGQNVDRMA
jgi:DNA-binding protein H-NS